MNFFSLTVNRQQLANLCSMPLCLTKKNKADKQIRMQLKKKKPMLDMEDAYGEWLSNNQIVLTSKKKTQQNYLNKDCIVMQTKQHFV
jgi:hypothetical protein